MTEAGGLGIMADRSGDVARCPDRDELAAFERGQLSLERLETIAEHVSRCAACETTLQQLQAENQIVRYLRLPPSEGLCLDESVYARLEDRARNVLRQQIEPPTITEAGGGGRETPRLPMPFGSYLLLDQLPTTGMGVVFQARQGSLKRMVALKVIKAAILASAEARNRFRLEAETLARVRHANVVQIHEFGEYQGEPFFTMEWLDGGTLQKKLDGRPQDERQAAELMRTLARAVQALHAAKIVHRDLKPANILFDTDGTPKIADFGLVKLIGESGDNTQPGVVLGTPAYMAPEQARESRDIGNAADVYALGVILYEMLTGRVPLKGLTPLETMDLVRTQEPEWPSKHRRKLDRHLEAICMKCLEKNSADRYPSAAALADQLDRWLKNEPTFPPPPSWVARMRRAVRRHPRTVAAACLGVLLLALVPAVLWYRDADRPVKNIEGRLSRGETVTLIGDKGKPAWHSFPTGGTVYFDQAPDGACLLDSWTRTLLELVRDPQLEEYRFQVEVRHEKSSQPGRVGIYFAHQTFQAGPDPVHYLGSLTFDDIADLRVAYKNALPQMPNPPPPPTGNPVFLWPEAFSPDAQGGEWVAGGIVGLNPTLFEAAGLGGGRWRRLVVEVTPRSVRGFWGEKEDSVLVPVGELNAQTWVRNTQHKIDRWNKQKPGEPHANSVRPEWKPRGSLGLYLYRGSASFRRVVVEPLNPSP
jgi:serine/threonine-protein kinase